MTDLVNQPSSEPTRKTTAAIIGGSGSTAVAVVLDWVLTTYTHVQVPGAVEVAIAALITIGASYLTKERATS